MPLLVSPITQHDSIPVYARDQHDLNKIIGANIRSLQKKTNLSQREFLEIIGFDHKYANQYFAKLARGETGICLHTLLIIQKTFTVTLEQLVTPQGM